MTTSRRLHPEIVILVMALTEPIRIVRIESRWPVALVMLAAVVLLSLLPARLRIFPIWLPFVLCVVVIVPMAALSLSTRKASWLRLENAAIAIILLFAAVELRAGWWHPGR